MSRSPIHLPGLNGIRSIAAITVLVFHVDQFSQRFGVPALGFSENGFALYAVLLFFVLSGYLITYLLLLEKAAYGRVDTRRFYIRRILRIWPLYYLSVFGAVILVVTGAATASGGAVKTFLLYALVLPNVGYGLGYAVLAIIPLWSVGVEEQFYALWPLVINRARSPARALLGVLAGYLAIKLCLRLTENGVIYGTVGSSPYSCMAIGGLVAVAAVTRSRWLQIMFSPATQVVCWMMLVLSIVFGPLHTFSFIDFEVNALPYAVIIANVSLNPKSLLSLEHRLYDLLGTVSYGIYVWHLPWLLFSAYLIRDRAHIALPHTLAGYVVIYTVVIAGTLLVAAASYRWIERPFLRRKATFANIATAPAASAD